MNLPRLYPILCASLAEGRPDPQQHLLSIARELLDAGVRILQYRNKHGPPRQMLGDARALGRLAQGAGCTLIFNDRADLALAAGFDGVHIGQGDLSPEGARRVVGPERIVGVSTHNEDQLRAADATDADYLAVGPVFPTRSKENPDPVVGLEGVRAARRLTRKPLVAIGGITLENCRSVLDAGADSVAVLSAFSEHPGKVAEDFLRVLQ